MDSIIGIRMVIVTTFASIVSAGYDFKCPDGPHRKFRAKWLCNLMEEKYSCLLDLQKKKFSESCSLMSDFVRPGQKYVISGRRKNVNCSNERYQPLKFYSSELSKCAFLKSLCREEGQIISSESSSREDHSCRCDYTRGYTFLSSPKHQCFCSPGEADCSCYIGKCPKISSLSSDYVCKVGLSPVDICQPIVYTGHKENAEKVVGRKGIALSSITREKRSLVLITVMVLITVLVISGFMPIVIYFEDISAFLRQKFNDFYCHDCKKIDGDNDQDIADGTDATQTTIQDQSCNLPSSKTMLSTVNHIGHVRKMYDCLEKILQMKEFNKDLQEELSTQYPDNGYINVLQSSKRDLVRNDCGIIVTGETSAGKTTLINQFVGLKILPTNNVAATATVCRIRDSKKLMLKASTKDGRILTTQNFDNMKDMKSVIKKFTDISHISEDMKDKIFYTDVYLPIPILQGNVIIVDTPGIGESKDLDSILLDILPQAVSFIFVVNARNAGGIHEDRLLKIFQKILENIENMPCFDPREVFFLTNQWDIVDDDDDDDDDGIGTGSRTWKSILSKLKIGWPGVECNRIFQISLKQVGTKSKNKYTEEFQRFEADLKDTIIRNQNKRVDYYIRFLQDFVRNAERGIAARLNLLERTEKEQNQIIQGYLKRIECLEADNTQQKHDLENSKCSILHTLADTLFQYLHSNSAKEEILNPTGSTAIEKCELEQFENVIRSRLNDAIQQWFNGSVVKKKIEDANKLIFLAVNKIELEIENIEVDMTGIKPRSILKEKIELPIMIMARRSLIGMLYFPIYCVVFELSNLFSEVFLGQEGRRTLAENTYKDVLKEISKEKLQGILEESIGSQYSKTITRLFEVYIPNKIKSMRKTNEKMMEEYFSVRSKHGSFSKLSTMMKNLKAEIQNITTQKR